MSAQQTLVAETIVSSGNSISTSTSIDIITPNSNSRQFLHSLPWSGVSH